MMLLTVCGPIGIAGCREQANTVQEEPWILMEDSWEGVTGGQVDVGESLKIGWGESITTVKWLGEVPEAPFELKLKAKRLDGTDFFCAVTFPGGGEDEFVTLIVGGWGGGGSGNFLD